MRGREIMRSLFFMLFVVFGGYSLAQEIEVPKTNPVPQLSIEIERDVVIAALMDCSVSVIAGPSQGSGIVFTKKKDEVEYTFVLTAAHNLSVLRTVTDVITPDGFSRKLVKFDDPAVVNVLFSNYAIVGEMRARAKIIRYSAPGAAGDDLALLHLPVRDFTKSSARLYFGVPKVGSNLFHVGSIRGLTGAESLTTGILSQHGRSIGRNIFDQTTAPIDRGSSGGLMSLQSNGQVVGVVARMANPVYNFIIPSRRIIEWSRRTKVDWLFDEQQEMPPLNEVFSFPIEDIKTR